MDCNTPESNTGATPDINTGVDTAAFDNDSDTDLNQMVTSPAGVSTEEKKLRKAL